MTKANIEALTKQFPLLAALIDLEEVCWFNPHITSLEEGLPHVGLGEQDIQVASERLTRFAPYLMKAFPETETSRGIIESPVVDIPNMKVRLEQQYDTPILGHLMLKKDSHLPISGSIKARGGIYEVLTHAESWRLKPACSVKTMITENCSAMSFGSFLSSTVLRLAQPAILVCPSAS